MNSPTFANPAWQTLVGDHATLSEGDAIARRYRRAITQIGAMAEDTPAAYAALARITDRGEILYLATPGRTPLPAGWTLEAEKPMRQMHLTQPAEVAPDHPAVRELGPADSAAMVALAELTQPGPFGPEAWRMGRYLGLFENGRLVAMAGQRYAFTGFREISAVCTHPDWQRRGLARMLMSRLVRAIQDEGRMPFLHVLAENHRACALYERTGFVTQCELWARIVRRTA